MQKRSLSILVGLVSYGCAHTSGELQVRIAEDLEFALLPPAAFGESLVLTQAASIEFGDEKHDLLFYTEISADNISLAGTLPNGTRLFSITYDGQSIQSDGNQDLLGRITPGYFLADLQLAQWPLATVAKVLGQTNSCFTSGSCVISETADQLKRSVSRDEQVVIDIHYSAVPHYLGTTSYEHHERGYKLQIETLDVQPLAEVSP